MTKLGSLENYISFENLNKDLIESQKPYYSMIQRCEELEKILNLFSSGEILVSEMINESEENINNNNKEEEVYNTTRPFRPPLKNDEEHYHQNLTIKIQNREEENKPQIKYVDNTPEGCVVINNNNNLERKNIKKNYIYQIVIKI